MGFLVRLSFSIEDYEGMGVSHFFKNVDISDYIPTLGDTLPHYV